MNIAPSARDHLAGVMEARRLDLGLSWRDVATRAGLSYEMVMKLRHRATSVRTLTLRKLDTGLGWEPGSIEQVLNGGQPTAVPADEALTARDAYEAAVLASSLPTAEKSEAIGAHRERMARELAELGVTEVPEFIRRGVRRLAAEQDGEDGSASRQAGRPA